ncbi:hypothetical protein CRM22_000995 [Opisthorchis felineus]|uniref:GOLD domain-containing protein n=1 Tax=Opisthorchis felineus TaxID=147828 RepID=A0A4S2MCU1_OPIFE|nr:hypothetical protein CRM22_000995 [Opisthorchis felineus]
MQQNATLWLKKFYSTHKGFAGKCTVRPGRGATTRTLNLQISTTPYLSVNKPIRAVWPIQVFFSVSVAYSGRMKPPVTFPTCGADLQNEYGIDLDAAYHIAHKFLSENGEKAFHLSFDDRTFLSALGFQVKYGKFDGSKSESPGFFDFVGRRRIAQWSALGDMGREKAMWEFVCTMNKLCPLFLPYLEAHCRHLRNSHDVSEVQLGEQQSPPSSKIQTPPPSPAFSTNEERSFILQNETGIRMALNAQTREQFEKYAMEHFPDDVSKRQELIAHLQDCHFHEYVTYIQQQYALARQRQLTEKASNSIDSPTQDAEEPHTSSDLSPRTRINENGPSVKVSGESVVKLMDSMEKVASTVVSQTNSDATHHADTQLPRPPNPNLVADESTTDHLSDAIVPTSQSENVNASAPEEEPLGNEQAASPGALIRTPTMWTRSEIDEFKESLADAKDAIVQVGCGEVITIRVPAYPAGSCIVWEFATDSYDIGFGLFFEWASPESEVHQQQPDFPVDHDKSSASEQVSMSPAYAPPLVDEIVPVYRRNSHQEIYCGSHIYPGLGTYLFKFDNSYSLWRSKMLYYRVYYTC